MVVEITKELIHEIIPMVKRNWGSGFIVSKGKIHKITELSGIAKMDNNKVMGICFYEFNNSECEIVLLESYKENNGIGTELVDAMYKKAKANSIKRIWLVTTNDNTDAMRFYQIKGFTISTIFKGSINYSRKLKPQIPFIGNNGIPILDEIELEKILS